MSNRFLKTVSIYQIIGGILGIITVIYSLLNSSNLFLSNQLPTYQLLIIVGVYVFVLIVYIFSIISGFYMLKNKKIGFIISIIVQFLQIPYLVTPKLIYYLINGMFLGARLGRMSNAFGIYFFFRIGSTFSIYLENNIDGFMLGLNIIPVVIIIFLLITMRNRIINNQYKETLNIQETQENSLETVESHDNNTIDNNENGEM